LLWRRETEGKNFDSPERKAALDKTLREALKKIKDPSVRGHYGEEVKQLRWELFRGARQPAKNRNRNWRPGGRNAPEPTRAATKTSMLAMEGGLAAEERLRESVILATLVSNPEILAEFESELQEMAPATPELKAVHSALLRCIDTSPELLREKVEAFAGADALEKLFEPIHVQLAAPVRNPGDPETALLCVAQELAKLHSKRGALREIADAAVDMGDAADEGITWRLSQAAEARNRAEKSEAKDDVEYETGENGAPVSRDERSAFEQLLGKIDFAKGQKHT
jgi:DNA primase